MGRVFPCSIGRGGVTRNKHEGDGATPAGTHRIVGVAYRADRMAHLWGGRQGPFRMKALRHGDIWSDDPADPAYNHGLNSEDHPFSHERMWRADPLYDLVLMTDWNWPNAVSGRGSAIFIHQWRRPGYPTEGCVAFRRNHLYWIAEHIVPATRLIVLARD